MQNPNRYERRNVEGKVASAAEVEIRVAVRKTAALIRFPVMAVNSWEGLPNMKERLAGIRIREGWSIWQI